MSLREARANEFEDDPFDKLEDNLSDEWIKKAEDYLGEIQSLRYFKILLKVFFVAYNLFQTKVFGRI